MATPNRTVGKSVAPPAPLARRFGAPLAAASPPIPTPISNGSATKAAPRSDMSDETAARGDLPDDLPWDQLYDQAEKIIDRTIKSLPAPIREKAGKIQTLFDKWPPDDDDEMLGQFHGFEPD